MRFLFLLFVFTFQVFAEPIQDNSFLLEEAYNQEPGVVQFIQTYKKNDDTNDWEYQFTNEYPIKNEENQFSFMIPVQRIDATDKQGTGDIALNYRHQLLKREGVVMAPRFSILVPTGDYKNELGNGAVGYQFNNAISIEISDKWVTHWNFGATVTPNAKGAYGNKGDLRSFNWGASVIWLAHEKLNALVEFVGENEEKLTATGKEYEPKFVINPGIRGAIDFPSTQIVPGFSIPIGVGPSEGEISYFTYFSIEPKLW